MNSIMRLFARDSVSHCSRSFLFVHLCSRGLERKKHQFPEKTLEICVSDAQSTKEKWVRARERLHGNFDGPDIIVIQKTS